MKTQISNLVRGNGQVIGTPTAERIEVAMKVREENPESMIIEFRGQKFVLSAHWSISRKSVSYTTEIPVELYESIFGDYGLPKNNPKCFLTIDTNVNVSLWTNSKKFFIKYINESEITIL